MSKIGSYSFTVLCTNDKFVEKVQSDLAKEKLISSVQKSSSVAYDLQGTFLPAKRSTVMEDVQTFYGLHRKEVLEIMVVRS